MRYTGYRYNDGIQYYFYTITFINTNDGKYFNQLSFNNLKLLENINSKILLVSLKQKRYKFNLNFF